MKKRSGNLFEAQNVTSILLAIGVFVIMGIATKNWAIALGVGAGVFLMFGIFKQEVK